MTNDPRIGNVLQQTMFKIELDLSKIAAELQTLNTTLKTLLTEEKKDAH